jgi:hypothetical protein
VVAGVVMKGTATLYVLVLMVREPELPLVVAVSATEGVVRPLATVSVQAVAAGIIDVAAVSENTMLAPVAT